MNRFLAFLGSRKAFAAGVAFGLTAVFAFTLGVRMGFSQLVFAGRGPYAFQGTLFSWVLLIGIGGPFFFALLAAYFTPENRSARPGPLSYFRNFATWVLAAITGPTALLAWYVMNENKSIQANAVAAKHFSRPIVDADTAGLCAPPIYGVEDSIPTVVLTARLPRDEHYGFRFDAVDHAGQKLIGFQHADFAAGVQTVKLKAKLDSNSPIADPPPPLHVVYPVVIKYLRVETFRTTLRDDPNYWEDIRVADTLAVIPGP
jgi:hypothetical protein